jgi:hypothetical protein
MGAAAIYLGAAAIPGFTNLSVSVKRGFVVALQIGQVIRGWRGNQ